MPHAHFFAEIDVVDAEALKRHVLVADPEIDTDDMTEVVERALVDPRRASLDVGYEMQKISVTDEGDGRFVLHVTAEIGDPAAFLAEAAASHAASFPAEAAFEPQDLGHALFEIVLASNAAPSPCEIGFETVTYSHGGDALPSNAPSA